MQEILFNMARDFLSEIEKVNVPPVKYLVITHAHWDHFLGMNEFNATIIVNSLTNQLLNTWRNKICFIERIRSTHTDDSTIVYVPDEKAIFLGDSFYGTTQNSLFHYKKSHLEPMIEDIQKFDASHFIAGHESICDIEEMDLFWKELRLASKATNSTSLEESLETFEKENKRKPIGDELFFIKAFVNDQILHSEER